MRAALVVHAGRPSAEDDAHDVVLTQHRRIHQARVQLAEDVQLPHASRDEMAVLRAKVQDCDLLAVRLELRALHEEVRHRCEFKINVEDFKFKGRQRHRGPLRCTAVENDGVHFHFSSFDFTQRV